MPGSRGKERAESSQTSSKPGVTRIERGARLEPWRFGRNGRWCVGRCRGGGFRRDRYGRGLASVNRRRGNCGFFLRASRGFDSIGRRVRSREWAARPIPFRLPNEALDFFPRCFGFFHSKAANAEAAPKWYEPLERVACQQV